MAWRLSANDVASFSQWRGVFEVGVEISLTPIKPTHAKPLEPRTKGVMTSRVIYFKCTIQVSAHSRITGSSGSVYSCCSNNCLLHLFATYIHLSKICVIGLNQ